MIAIFDGFFRCTATFGNTVTVLPHPLYVPHFICFNNCRLCRLQRQRGCPGNQTLLSTLRRRFPTHFTDTECLITVKQGFRRQSWHVVMENCVGMDAQIVSYTFQSSLSHPRSRSFFFDSKNLPFASTPLSCYVNLVTNYFSLAPDFVIW